MFEVIINHRIAIVDTQLVIFILKLVLREEHKLVVSFRSFVFNLEIKLSKEHT